MAESPAEKAPSQKQPPEAADEDAKKFDLTEIVLMLLISVFNDAVVFFADLALSIPFVGLVFEGNAVFITAAVSMTILFWTTMKTGVFGVAGVVQSVAWLGETFGLPGLKTVSAILTIIAVNYPKLLLLIAAFFTGGTAAAAEGSVATAEGATVTREIATTGTELAEKKAATETAKKEGQAAGTRKTTGTGEAEEPEKESSRRKEETEEERQKRETEQFGARKSVEEEAKEDAGLGGSRGSDKEKEEDEEEGPQETTGDEPSQKESPHRVILDNDNVFLDRSKDDSIKEDPAKPYNNVVPINGGRKDGDAPEKAQPENPAAQEDSLAA